MNFLKVFYNISKDIKILRRMSSILANKQMSRVVLTKDAELGDNGSLKHRTDIGNGRYKPICRLDYGSFSTVWIAEDRRCDNIR